MTRSMLPKEVKFSSSNSKVRCALGAMIGGYPEGSDDQGQDAVLHHPFNVALSSRQRSHLYPRTHTLKQISYDIALLRLKPLQHLCVRASPIYLEAE